MREDTTSRARKGISGEPMRKRKKTVASRFCARCAAIDNRRLSAHRYDALFLDPPWTPDGCDFCWFVVQSLLIAMSESCDSKEMSICLQGQDAVPSLAVGIMWQTIGALGSYCRCYRLGILGPYDHYSILARTSFDLATSGIVTTPMINYALIKGWLQQGPDGRSGLTRLWGTKDDLLPGPSEADDMMLRVIDCADRSLKRLPSRAQLLH